MSWVRRAWVELLDEWSRPPRTPQGYMATRPEAAVGVEPPDPFQGGKPDILETAPRASSPNDLRLEESDRGFGQCVVVAIAPAGASGSPPHA